VFGGGQFAAGIASIAGLPLTKARVCVGPPLFARVVSRMALSATLGTMSVAPGVKLVPETAVKTEQVEVVYIDGAKIIVNLRRAATGVA
jgi:hypothetical protein